MEKHHRYTAIKKGQREAYSKLSTPEQRLYAACTSFDDDLMSKSFDELKLYPIQASKMIKIVKDALEEKGDHGCMVNVLKFEAAINHIWSTARVSGGRAEG